MASRRSLFAKRLGLVMALLIAAVTPSAAIAGEPVAFKTDVMAVLSKAGCNLGACHANTNGKGGFKLSLRGEDPAADYAALVRQVDQRRVNLLDPEASLILQKPTGRVAHQGVVRFHADWQQYRILIDWITAGAAAPDSEGPQAVRLEVTPTAAVVVEPVQQVQLQAIAHFSDGSQRD